MFSKHIPLLTILTLLPVLFIVDVKAESLLVNLNYELQNADIVTPAKIISYDSDSLKFQPPGGTVIMSARYSTDPTWNPSRFIHIEWPPKDEKVSMTAEWPPVGAEVLIVVDKANVISLFAWPYGEKYRFWSPMMTGSFAFFNCISLDGAPLNLFSRDDPPDASTDGCLVDKSRIVTKGITIFIPDNEPAEKSSKIALSVVIVILLVVVVYFIFRRRQQMKSS